MVKAACVWYRAFSQELLPENFLCCHIIGEIATPVCALARNDNIKVVGSDG